LIVNQSQEAVFLRGGEIADIFGPGTKTLSTNNIPVLQKLINLPFGGKTPFTAEVWFVSKTVRRNLKFGTERPIDIWDPMIQNSVPVRAFGQYGIRIADSAAFVQEMVGTLHLFTTDDITEQFRSDIIQALSERINNFMTAEQMSVVTINGRLSDISKYIQEQVNSEFDRYGIEVTNLKLENINYDKNDPQVSRILEVYAKAKERAVQGSTYQQERQFDILETAAGNEGSSGDTMGIGLGLGMGAGIGAAFNSQISNIATNVMGSPVQNANSVPPPTPVTNQSVSFYLSINGQQFGPYDMTALSQMVANRQMTPNTYVWRPGMAQWLQATQCPELKHLFSLSIIRSSEPTSRS
ncbi:MAG: SPFH domain-containing protein, partial [Acetatifactor sp.]|nr:SPFH domain-containing protein [Acetatifactor sp.]